MMNEDGEVFEGQVHLKLRFINRYLDCLLHSRT